MLVVKLAVSAQSHLYKRLFNFFGFFAVFGSNIWLELRTSFLRQSRLSSWACLSKSFSLPCIDPQSPSCTVSWNGLKSHQTCVWTRQDFWWWLTGTKLLFAAGVYGMSKEGHRNAYDWVLGLSLACLLLVAWKDGHPKVCGGRRSGVAICCCLSLTTCLFHNIYRITVLDGTQPSLDLHYCKI